ncbi:MAG: hypothetical protein AB7S26_12205 [Sandaracinaceae bacterium]
MSTGQYGVRVNKKNGLFVDLTVMSISEDSPVPPGADELGFFARVLCDDLRRRSPLATRMEEDGGDPWDGAWLRSHVEDYIGSVELLRAKNLDAEPRSSSLSRRKRAFAHEADLAQAEFRLTVMDESFVAHLREGDVWESVAFSSDLLIDPSGDDAAGEYVESEEEKEERRRELEAVARMMEEATVALDALEIVYGRLSGPSLYASAHFCLANEDDRKLAVKALVAAGFEHAGTEYGTSTFRRDAALLHLELFDPKTKVEVEMPDGGLERVDLNRGGTRATARA